MKSKSLLLLLTFVFLMSGGSPLSARQVTDTVSVTVAVMDPSGAAVPAAQIKLSPAPAKAPKNPETNEYGELSLDLFPGSYDLFVSFPGFVPWAKHIQAQKTSDQKIRVVLQIAETTSIVEMGGPHGPLGIHSAPPPPVVASFTILVKDAAGVAIPYAQVGGIRGGVGSRFPETDEYGKLSIKLIVGSYYLEVRRPGFRRWTKRVRVQSAESQTANVVLEAVDNPPSDWARTSRSFMCSGE